METLTVETWLKSELLPLLNDVNRKLVENGKKHNTDIAFAEWWAVFIKDTVVLFEILEKKNQTRQFAMTIRSLIEFAADVSFLSKFPKNIIYQQKRIEKFINNTTGDFSYQDIANESRKYKLKCPLPGKKYDEAPTRDRVRMAFDKDILTLYDYVNCFTHFNIFGIRIDLNINNKAEHILSERLLLIKYYPIIFRAMTVAMGILCDIDDLKQYDCSKITKVFKVFADNCHLVIV